MDLADPSSPSTPRGRRFAVSPVAWAVLLSILGGALLSAQPRLEPKQAEWRKLTFVASKLLLTVESEVALELVPRKRALAELREAREGRGMTPGRKGAVLITTRTDFLGRLSVDRLWADAQTGAALQRTVIETGSRDRYKTTRFTDRGVEIERRYPAAGEESEGVAPEKWSDVSTELVPWPEQLPDGEAVIEAATFFYLAAVAPLDRPGDSLETHLWAGDRVNELVLYAEASERVDVDYQRIRGSEAEPVDGERESLRVTAQARSLTGEQTVVELLGLEDVVLHLDPERGLPLEVEGKVSIVGTVRASLKTVEPR